MDGKTALEYVERIERHREGEDEIWQEIRALPDYETNQDKDIVSILEHRARARFNQEEAEMYLSAFDAEPTL